jgi:hypothetical protein
MGEQSSSGASELGLPEGTEVIHNPSGEEEYDAVGFPDRSELDERHGKHFHLIGGSKRIAIEVVHFVERRRGFFRPPELEEDKTVYLLPVGTSYLEARRIGYRLLDQEPPNTNR